VNQKGGVGKTTVSVNLAAELAEYGATLLLDADPQKSATGWVSRAPNDKPYPAEVRSANSAEDILALHTLDFAYVVIDGPPSLESPRMDASLQVADLALVPVTPSVIDLTSMVEATVVSIDGARGKRSARGRRYPSLCDRMESVECAYQRRCGGDTR
jgi:chromosome partitioning protein